MVEFDPVLVHEWLERSTEMFPDKPVIVTNKETLTYRQLHCQSTHLAEKICGMGIEHQDRVVILMNDSANIITAMYAVLKAGCVFVILEGSMKSQKLNFILNNSGAS